MNFSLSTRHRRRTKLLLTFATFLVLFLISGYLQITFAILIQGPAISRWHSDHIRISKERDGFDITFRSYPEEPEVEVNRNLPIPPILHHIFLGRNHRRNDTLTLCRASCMDMHPQYDFMFWDDDNSKEFVAQEFPEILPTWNSYPHLIQRADSLRYMVLYKYGGIFLDLDLRCLRPLDPLRRFEFVSVAATPMGISNGFLMSSPRHPFLESVVKSLPWYNINWLGLPYATVMFTTGCHFLSTMHALFPGRNDLRILWGPNRLHHLSGAVTTPLFQHLGLSSWHSFDGVVITSALPLFIFIAAFVISSMVFVVIGLIKYRHKAQHLFLA